MTTSSQETIRVFSARACAAPLEKAAALFESETGIHVEISVCSRHCANMQAEEATGRGGDDFLEEIDDAGIHDLAIGGAEYLLDDGEVRGIMVRGAPFSSLWFSFLMLAVLGTLVFSLSVLRFRRDLAPAGRSRTSPAISAGEESPPRPDASAGAAS